MPPLLGENPLLPKMAWILEVLDQIEEPEFSLKLAQSVMVPVVDRKAFEDFERADPNVEVTDPISHLAGVDLDALSRKYDGDVAEHLKDVKELLRKHYSFLLKVLLVTGGVTSVDPRAPKTEMDAKVLEQFGVSLLTEVEVEHGAKKAEPKEPNPKKRSVVKVSEPTSAVRLWLAERAKVFGEHVTKCVDRTVGLATDYVFSQGVKTITGGRIILPMDNSPKGLQVALPASKTNPDGAKSVVQAVKKPVKLVDTVTVGSPGKILQCDFKFGG